MGKFEINATKTGFSLRLKAGNGEIIAAGETYSSLDSAKNGAASIAKNAPIANLEDQTVEGYEQQKHPKFEVYQDKAGEYRFRLKASNGEIIAVSEGYVAKAGCMNGIDSVRRNAVDAKIVEPKED